MDIVEMQYICKMQVKLKFLIFTKNFAAAVDQKATNKYEEKKDWGVKFKELILKK